MKTNNKNLLAFLIDELNISRENEARLKMQRNVSIILNVLTVITFVLVINKISGLI